VPLVSTDHALLARLRSDLSSSGFTVDRLSGPDAWGPTAGAALFRGERVAARRALRRSARADEGIRTAATLALLFILGYPQPRVDVERALPTLGIDGAEALGLIETDETASTVSDVDGSDPAGSDPDETVRGVVRARVDLRPYAFVDGVGEAAWWIASDLGELALGGALREDHVLGVGGASATLAGLIVPRDVDRALDLGTGCGIQAMHVARHARHVVATDISTRALAFARFNAALNLIDGIEFRLGSLFEPVAGESFDHVVSNPPFVITPRLEGVPEYEYRDGGMEGDDLVASVVAEVGRHLTPGGIAQLLGNWESAGPGGAPAKKGAYSVADWASRGGVPLDVWVVERELQDPAAYAETWIRDGGTRPGTEEFERLYEAWLGDFEARRVEQVGFGYVMLRRPVDPAAVPVVRIERLLGAMGANEVGLGSHLLATIDAIDALRELDDDALLATHPRVAGDVTEERHYWPGNDDPTVLSLRQGGGFARSVESGTALSALVGASDGDLSAAAVVGALAQLLGVEEARLRVELAPRLRELVTVGMLRL
jgi:methylase of polypeptide subunit release factors